MSEARNALSIDRRPHLAATVSPLTTGSEQLGLREALGWLSSHGLRGVQLSATDAATRARDLSPSARRDVRATLARHELDCSGLDFFIPPSHYTDPTHVSRAFDALIGAIGLAADLGRAPVTAELPADAVELRAAVAAEGARRGVKVLVPTVTAAEVPAPPLAASVDCAAVLATGARPEELIARLGANLGGVRLADLLRNGMRGPILEPGLSRLDALAVRMALEVGGFGGSNGMPLIDARQWTSPAAGIASSVERWAGLV